MAMILISHDLGVIAGRADKVAVMYAGQLVEEATVFDLFAETRHPYTQALLASVPRLDEHPASLYPFPACRRIISHPRGVARFAPRCRYVAATATLGAALDHERSATRCLLPPGGPRGHGRPPSGPAAPRERRRGRSRAGSHR